MNPQMDYLNLQTSPTPVRYWYTLEYMLYRLQDSIIGSWLRLFVGIINYEFKFCSDPLFVLLY